MRVAMSNFVKIGQMVVEILPFYGFSKIAAAAMFDFQKFNFLPADTLGRPICVSLPNFIKIGQSVAEIWRIFDFSRWRLYGMLDF